MQPAAGRAAGNQGRSAARCNGMELTCPKCHGAMRSYERSGITIDQCTECRGVFLDRGELDKLIDTEARQPASPSPSVGAPWGAPPSREYDDDDRYRDEHRYDRYGAEDRGHGKKRKRSFLEDLFD
jgi:Zn-finger nucleic acid-binding protein